MDQNTFVFTVMGSAIGALVAGAVGFRFAWARFRRERAFDRRLNWYETAVKTLVDASNAVRWAMATDLANVAAPERQSAWSDAYQKLLNLRGLEIQAQLFATREGHTAVAEAVEHVTAISQVIWGALGGKGESPDPSITKLFEIEAKLLLHAAVALADDVRDHLQLGEIDREWSIYDKEYRALLDELAKLKALGHDYAAGAWGPPPSSSEAGTREPKGGP